MSYRFIVTVKITFENALTVLEVSNVVKRMVLLAQNCQMMLENGFTSLKTVKIAIRCASTVSEHSNVVKQLFFLLSNAVRKLFYRRRRTVKISLRMIVKLCERNVLTV